MLKKWLIDNGFLAADAKDDAVDIAVEKAMEEKKLTLAKYKSLLAEKSPEDKLAEERAAFAKMISDPIIAAVSATKALASVEVVAEEEVDEPTETKNVDIDALVAKAVAEALKAQKSSEEHLGTKIFSLSSTMSDEKHPDTVRVKSAAARFTDTKTQRTFVKGPHAGQPMTLECKGGKAVDVPSQLENALMAAWFKFQVCPEHLTEHDKSLLVYTVEHKDFVNVDQGSTESRRLHADEVADWKYRINTGFKANLLDDSTSGGQYAVPEFYDTNAILVPANVGELSPYVSITEVPRGHSAVSHQIGLPTITAVAEGTAQTVFDATAYVSTFTCSFYPAQCFIEVGRDLLSDAVPGFGAEIMTQMGKAFAAWMDEQIAVGDGTTEPQGVFNASGTSAIMSVNSSGGPLDIADLVNLVGGVSKPHFANYDRANARFIMTNAEYMAFRRLSTGITNDDRLLFGDDLKSYNLLNFGVSTPYSGLTNSQIAFVQLGGYRWYRRQGVQFGLETAGRTLTLSSTNLIYGRTRNGGKLERGAYAAVMTTAQS